MSNEILKSLIEVSSTKKNANDLVGAFKTAVASLSQLKTAVLSELNLRFANLKDTLTKDIEDTKGQLTAKVDAALKEQEDGLNFIRDKVRTLKDGYTPVKGVDYFDGAPADETKIVSSVLALIPPDVEETGDQIIDKINAADNLISASAITGLEDELTRLGKVAEKSGRTPGWGAHPLNIYQSGTIKAETARHINFTGATVSQSPSGVTTVAITGGAGGFSTLTATETPNGSLKVFTFAAAAAQPSFIISDNVMMQAVTKAGNTNWTWNAGLTQATLTVAPTDDILGIV